jgi:DNA-binding XRE family transcriptional regulator
MSESRTSQTPLPFGEADEPEHWLPVVGYEDLYAVSDLGRVRSFHAGRGKGKRGGLLKQVIQADYLTVALCRNGTQRNGKVHRLVMEAFIGPCPEGKQVRHGAGGRLDNRLVNLCYGTPGEDSDDKIRDGTMNFGEKHGLAKLTYAIVDECRRRHADGESQASLAREFGVSQKTMHRAISGETWRQAHALPVRARDGRGEAHGMARLTEADVTEIRRRHAAGETQRTIALDYGVARQHISRIVSGKRWHSAA